MDFCSHDGVTVEVGEYGSAKVTYAAPTAAFTPEILADDSPYLTVEGDRITICDTTVYEVTDWHHHCPGFVPDRDVALARLVSRPPQRGDLEVLLNQAVKAEGGPHGR